MQIKDKRAIVTGAASRLGLAFSRELLRNGAIVSKYFLIGRSVTFMDKQTLVFQSTIKLVALGTRLRDIWQDIERKKYKCFV